MNLQIELEILSKRKRQLEAMGLSIGDLPHESFVVSNSNSNNITLTVLALVHGDEIGGLSAINHFLQKIIRGEIKTNESFAVVLGNLPAAEQNVRFVEKDMNRCFQKKKSDCLEDRLAQELLPIIDRSHFLIDLHQTRVKTVSDFFIFPNSPLNVSWAASICKKTPIITHGLDFSSDGQTSDIYAAINGVVGITYEMGERGYDIAQINKTTDLLQRAYETCSKPLEAKKASNVFAYGQSISSGPNRRLIPGLINMTPVSAGQVIGYDGDREILVESDGYILFPKYGEQAKSSSELCQFAHRFVDGIRAFS